MRAYAALSGRLLLTRQAFSKPAIHEDRLCFKGLRNSAVRYFVAGLIGFVLVSSLRRLELILLSAGYIFLQSFCLSEFCTNFMPPCFGAIRGVLILKRFKKFLCVNFLLK